MKVCNLQNCLAEELKIDRTERAYTYMLERNEYLVKYTTGNNEAQKRDKENVGRAATLNGILKE